MSFVDLDKSTQDLFAGMASLGISAKPKRRFNTADIALQTARHSSRQRFDTDLTMTTPKSEKPRPLRERHQINSPPSTPRGLTYPLAGARQRAKNRRLALLRKTKASAAADEAELAKRGRDISEESRSIQSERDEMMYPRPERDFFGVAQDILIAHGIKHTGNVWETFAPKIERFLKQSHMSPGSYNKRELDNIIRAARETGEGTIPEMPHLDPPSEVAEDEPRTKPPSPVEMINLEEDEEEFPEALRMRGGAPEEEELEEGTRENPVLLGEEQVAQHGWGQDLGDIQPAAGAGGGDISESPKTEPETSPEQSPERDSEHAAREDQPASEVPQSSVDQLHAEIKRQPAHLPPFSGEYGRDWRGTHAAVADLPPSPSIEAIVLKNDQGEINPDFADDLATAESIRSDTMEPAPHPEYGQWPFWDEETMSEAREILVGGHAGARDLPQREREPFF